MKGHIKKTTFVLLGILAVGFLLREMLRPREPVYQGKRLSTLAANLIDPRPAVRRASAEALLRHWGIGRPAVPGLLKAIEDPDLDVRKAAAEALKTIDPEAASKAGAK